MKERADKLLVGRSLAPSREKAQALIMAGLVTAGGKPVAKAGELVDADAPLEVARPLPFVSRGGLKLEEALDRFGLDVRGLVALDIGASTGGFVDCLLQQGAKRVYAVDVDTKQLDWGLSKDPRVVAVEKNARALGPGDIPEPPDVVTMDVSFISVLKILPALGAIPGAWTLVALIKPQFEAGPKDVGKKGIIRDAAVHAAVLARVIEGARELGFGPAGLIRCSTRGQKGNVEFFVRWIRGSPGLNADSVPAWIKEAASHEQGA
jgi:23S rRNA (cytidine1920-2'-O)/16S rRNA (cytidine1409-2'-O)-methyltransferase